jgi:hypothetical protein
VNSDWQQETQRMVEQGKQAAGGVVSGGEMVIDADPDNGFFRVKLLNVQPPGMIPQLVSGFCYVLTNGAAMFNLRVKQHIRQSGESK